MTARIIRLGGDGHEEAQRLLPWYATSRLEADEQAKVAAHLAVCPTCQADLRFEQRLKGEIAGLPIEIGRDWAAMQRRIVQERRGRAGRQLLRGWRVASPWLGWAAAASIVAAVVVGWPAARPERYHALGANPGPAAGNLVVIFRPDTSEAAMRRMLVANHLRLVDGPTAADAYVLRAPPAERAEALARLRAEPQISLAEPIDPAPTP